MSNRLRAVTLVLAISAAALPAVLGTAAIGAQPSATANPPTRTCSTAGLHFTRKSEGVTYSVAVGNLKARVTTCAAARSLAGTVAKDLLHETKVPARIGGLKVTVKSPCTGCTPSIGVTAKSGQELVTFTLEGGA